MQALHDWMLDVPDRTRCVTLPVRRGGRCCLRGRLRRAAAMQFEQSEVRSSRAYLCVLARRSRRWSAREVVAGSHSTPAGLACSQSRSRAGLIRWRGKCDDVERSAVKCQHEHQMYVDTYMQY
jgi:hypothetical protein